jgi:hypothetical protein
VPFLLRWLVTTNQDPADGPAGLEAEVGFNILGPLAKSAVPPLIELLRRPPDENSDPAGRVMGVLGMLSAIGPDAVPALANALASGDERLRLSVLTALGRLRPSADPSAYWLGNEAAIRQVVTAALRDPSAEIRTAAAAILRPRPVGARQEIVRVSRHLVRFDGKPAVGAKVRLVSDHWVDGKPEVHEAVADAAGAISLPITQSNSLWVGRIVAKAEGCATTYELGVTGRPTNDPWRPVLRLGAPFKTEGKTLDADGRPLAGATVSLTWVQPHQHNQVVVNSTQEPATTTPELTARSAGDGSWAMEGIDFVHDKPIPVRAVFEAVAINPLRASILNLELRPETNAGPRTNYTLDFRLAPLIRVSGRVLNAGTGQPLAGASLGCGAGWTTIEGSAAVTDQVGRFELRILGPVPLLWFNVYRDGFVPASIVTARRDQATSAWPDTTNLVVRLRPLVEVSGALRDENGQALDEFVELQARFEEKLDDMWSENGSSRTDIFKPAADAAFAVKLPAGKITVTLISGGPRSGPAVGGPSAATTNKHRLEQVLEISGTGMKALQLKATEFSPPAGTTNASPPHTTNPPGGGAVANPPAAEPAKPPVFQIRLVLDEPAADTEPMRCTRPGQEPGSDKVLYVQKGPLLDETAVKAAAVSRGANQRAEVKVVFTAPGAKRFAETTRQNVGKRLAIVVDGQVYTAPKVTTETAGAAGVTLSNFTDQEAFDLAARLNGASRALAEPSPPPGRTNTPPLQAKQRYVSLTGTHRAPFTNWLTAATKIQAAVDVAADGETVWVAAGTYTGAGNRNVDFHGTNCALRSSGGPRVTIIDVQNANESRGFYFHSGETPNAVVDGFTIRNGSIQYSGGGGSGVYCLNSSPTIRHCVFATNRTHRFGAGVLAENASSPFIENCIFTGNSSQWGGAGLGTFGAGAKPTVRGCLFYDNKDNWGAIRFSAGATGAVSCCTVVRNSSSWKGSPGGISCDAGSVVRVQNTIVYGNTGVIPNQVGGADNGLGDLEITYSCVQSGFAGMGNITDDPLFTTDFHLLSNSPCINPDHKPGAVGSVDLEGNPRLSGATVDMGAYEFQGKPDAKNPDAAAVETAKDKEPTAPGPPGGLKATPESPAASQTNSPPLYLHCLGASLKNRGSTIHLLTVRVQPPEAFSVTVTNESFVPTPFIFTGEVKPSGDADHFLVSVRLAGTRDYTYLKREIGLERLYGPSGGGGGQRPNPRMFYSVLSTNSDPTAFLGKPNSRNLDPKVVEPAQDPEPAPGREGALFNGRDLKGWTGDTEHWSVTNGVILGRFANPPGVHEAALLWADGVFDDFELRLRFRGDGGAMIFRGRQWNGGRENYAARLDGSVDQTKTRNSDRHLSIRGQATVVTNLAGKDTLQPGARLASDAQVRSALLPGDWNQMLLRAQSNRIVCQLNGVTITDATDWSPRAAASGRLGFELWAPGPAISHIEFKDVLLKRLGPSPSPGPVSGENAPTRANSSPDGATNRPTPNVTARPISISNFLLSMNKRFGVHFTMEILSGQGQRSILNSLAVTRIEEPKQVENVEALAALIRDILPNCEVRVSAGNSNAIHLIDERLSRLEDYPLNKRATIQYSGPVGGPDSSLAMALRAKVPGILAQQRGGAMYQGFDDQTTKVTVDARNEEVRRILTDYVPLQNYSIFVWRAVTQDLQGKETTVVQFYGPRRN